MSASALIGTDATKHEPVLLPLKSRMQGLYVLGRAGMGKTNFLLSLIKQDIEAGYGVCVLDPHGDLILDTLACVPSSRAKDVLLLDLQDYDHPFAFDLFAGVNPTDPLSLSSGVERVVSIFKKVWGDVSWGPRLEDLLGNAAYTLFFNPGTTLVDLPKLLTDPAYRRQLVRNVYDPVVRDFWEVEYDPLSQSGQARIYAPLMNKLRAFLRHPLLTRIVSQSGRTIDFSDVLARQQILLVRLDPELEEASTLLGAAVVLRILAAALGRRSLPVAHRTPFFLYADEFPRFATTTFARFLQEARKYAVGTTLAHQFRSQLTSYLQDSVKAAVNVVCFQLLSDDAREMSREFLSPTERDWVQCALEHPDPTIREAARELVEILPHHDMHHPGLPRRAMNLDDKRQELNNVLEYNSKISNPIKFIHGDLYFSRKRRPHDSLVFRNLGVLSPAVSSGVIKKTPNPSFDPHTLVSLPMGQAAGRLRIGEKMQQHLLQIPQAISPELSLVTHAALAFEKDPYVFNGMNPTTLSREDGIETIKRVITIRNRNRLLYHNSSPEEDEGTASPSPSDPPKPPQPTARPIPVMPEVDAEDEDEWVSSAV